MGTYDIDHFVRVRKAPHPTFLKRILALPEEKEPEPNRSSDKQMKISGTQRVVNLNTIEWHTPSGIQINWLCYDTHSMGSLGSFPRRILRSGVGVATVTIFDPCNEDIDVTAMTRHLERLAKAGLSHLTLAGSNGEGVHLSHQERISLIKHCRTTLDGFNLSDVPIIVNCSGESVREVLEYCRETQEAGGDFALLLPPSYYKGALTDASIVSFYEAVASQSPVPIVIYNYPPVVAGVDLDSDLILRLSKHSNIVGCKLTCGNVGKVARIAKATKVTTSESPEPGFCCLTGLADCTIQTLISGGSGIITGLGNVVPKSCVKLFNLYAAGKLEEARKVQAMIAEADSVLVAGGVTSVKSVLSHFYHYGGSPRRPLPMAQKEQSAKWAKAIAEVVEYENSI